MPYLDDHIEPGERVIWQTGSLRGEALQNVGWGAVVAAIVAVAAIWFDEDFPILILAFAAVVLFVRWARRPAETWLTDRRVLFQNGVLRPRVTAVDRSEIHRLEMFAEDDTLSLHGKDGELHRASLADKPDHLIDELGLPVTIWRDRVPPHLLNLTHLAFALAPVFGVLILIPAFVVAIILTGREPLGVIMQWLDLLWPGFFVVATFAILMALSTLVGESFMALLRRVLLTSTELTTFRRAVRYPIWAGNDPQSPLYRNWLYRFYRAVRLTLDRLLYGRPPECGTPEPDIIEPGDLDKLRD